MNHVRLDKWLWAVRIYKTRNDASNACRSSATRVNGMIAKPSTKLCIGDTVTTRTKALTRRLQVVGLTEKRVGAPLVVEYADDQTSNSEYEAARERRFNARLFKHENGGRPTKKDRRNIEKQLGLESHF